MSRHNVAHGGSMHTRSTDSGSEHHLWFGRSRNLMGVEVVRMRRSPRRWRMWQDAYGVASLLTPLRAEPALRFVHPGEILVIGDAAAPIDFDLLMLQPALVEKLALIHGLTPGPVVRLGPPSDRARSEIVARTVRVIADHPNLARSEVVARLRTLLEASVTHGPPDAGPRTSSLVLRAEAHARASYEQRFDLDTFSRSCGVAKSTLGHRLPIEIGATPRELWSMVRTWVAKERLCAGVTPIQVAADLFADQAQLIRHFKHWLGVTPGRYMRMLDASERSATRCTVVTRGNGSQRGQLAQRRLPSVVAQIGADGSHSVQMSETRLLRDGETLCHQLLSPERIGNPSCQ
jgi:AraC-like DNA-binding protein